MAEYWRRIRAQASGKTAAVFVLLAGLLVTALIGRSEQARLHAESNVAVLEQANALAARIKQRLVAYEIALRGGASLFAATAYPSRQQWRAYVDALDLANAFPGLRAVGFAAWLEPGQVEAFGNRVRNEGFPDFQIWPPGPRAEISTIVYIEPFDAANLRAFGFDMYSEPVRREAMRAARDSARPTLTGPVALVQDAGAVHPAAVLMYLPVYQYGAAIDTVAQRRAALAGWVYAPFRPADLVTGVGRDAGRPLFVRLFDGRLPDARTLLYSDESPAPAVAGAGGGSARVPIEVLGRVWVLEAQAMPEPAGEALLGSRMPWKPLAGGALISLLLFAVVWSMTTTRDRAHALAQTMTLALRRANEELDSRVRERTADLTAANRQLRQEIVERERIERERADVLARERERNAQLRALADASVGISLSTDYAARLEYLADRACNIVGCSYAVIRRADGTGQTSIAATLPLSAEERRALLAASEHWPEGERLEVVAYVALDAKADAAAATEQMMIVPVQVGRSPRIGTLYLLQTGGRRFGDEDPLIVRQLVLLVTAAMATADAVESERHARIDAEAANRTKDEFLAIVSHELRTPLHAIVGWLNVIEHKGASGEQLRRALDVIHRNVDAQRVLIDDLLDLARVERGKLVLDLEPVRLDALVAAAVESHRQVAAQKHLELHLRIDARGEVNCDVVRLQQAVGNLLADAVKFTPAGGQVTVSLRREDGTYAIEVLDTGQGIEADMLPGVFERFRQADSSSRRRQGGLGLGLALVRHIVQSHGGSVSAFSAGSGKGASFTIRLPALESAAPTALEASPPEAAAIEVGAIEVGTIEAPASAGGAMSMSATTGTADRAARADVADRATQARVMVIDDHDDAREALAQWLRDEAFEEVSFASVDAAIGWLEKQERSHWPDAVLCDIAMPDRDGYEFLDALRALEARRGHGGSPLPVAALTAYAGRDERERALSYGFAAHLAKPASSERLLRFLERALT